MDGRVLDIKGIDCGYYPVRGRSGTTLGDGVVIQFKIFHWICRPERVEVGIIARRLKIGWEIVPPSDGSCYLGGPYHHRIAAGRTFEVMNVAMVNSDIVSILDPNPGFGNVGPVDPIDFKIRNGLASIRSGRRG